MINERKTIDMGGLDLGAMLWVTWGISYGDSGHPLGPELFAIDGRSLGRWRAEDAGREFLGWQT